MFDNFGQAKRKIAIASWEFIRANPTKRLKTDHVSLQLTRALTSEPKSRQNALIRSHSHNFMQKTPPKHISQQRIW